MCRMTLPGKLNKQEINSLSKTMRTAAQTAVLMAIAIPGIIFASGFSGDSGSILTIQRHLFSANCTRVRSKYYCSWGYYGVDYNNTHDNSLSKIKPSEFVAGRGYAKDSSILKYTLKISLMSTFNLVLLMILVMSIYLFQYSAK